MRGANEGRPIAPVGNFCKVGIDDQGDRLRGDRSWLPPFPPAMVRDIPTTNLVIPAKAGIPLVLPA
jgi:hypothetical protein